MHTFTGSYEGGPQRQLEVGILNSVGDGGAVSKVLTNTLNGAGYITEVDEPYSAVSG
jgi:predicted N-formylglutamate amidohydrolase